MAWQHIEDAIDGRTFTLDGVSGTLRVYRTPHARRITHEANARGKRSRAYRETKAKLRDDYDTELTWSERIVTIAYRILGTTEADRLANLPAEGKLSERSA